MIDIEGLKQDPEFKKLSRKKKQAMVKDSILRNEQESGENPPPLTNPLEQRVRETQSQIQTPSFEIDHDGLPPTRVPEKTPTPRPTPPERPPVSTMLSDPGGFRQQEQDMAAAELAIRERKEDQIALLQELGKDWNANGAWQRMQEIKSAIESPGIFQANDFDFDNETGFKRTQEHPPAHSCGL